MSLPASKQAIGSQKNINKTCLEKIKIGSIHEIKPETEEINGERSEKNKQVSWRILSKSKNFNHNFEKLGVKFEYICLQ